METPLQSCARITDALEDLVRQEAAALHGGDFATLVLLQDRAAPLVEHLVAHQHQISSRELRSRVTAVIALRNQTSERLAQQIEQTGDELRAMDASRRRVAQVAPAYGRSAVRAPQFVVVG